MAARHLFFSRGWMGRQTLSVKSYDVLRAVIDDVITSPEAQHSDLETMIHLRPDVEVTTREPSAASTFLNDHTRPDAEKTISTRRTGSGAEIPVGDSNPDEPGFRFRVMSYNVLTDNCIRDGQYLYCPVEVRYMDTRHGRIMDEIRTVDPGVVCLQEADEDHFRKRLRPEMEKLGYAGINKATSDGQGLATFWRSSAFQLVKQRSILLSDVIDDHIEQNVFMDASKKTALKEWSRRPEVSVIVHLRHLATGRDIAVCNNHVGWMGLRHPTLQALQVAVALRELIEFVDPAISSLVFCGDLNSPPSFPAYRLLSRGYLSRKALEKFTHENSHMDEPDRKNFSVIIDSIPDIFQLPFLLESAYVSVLGREPSVTNCDGAHEDGLVRSFCLDYIWYRKLEPVRVLETPSVAVVTEQVALPSTKFPSDHISIAAEFLFT